MGRKTKEAKVAFDGFPQKGVEFLRQLAEHNDREWFSRHKPDYDEFLLAPARDFVTAMGARLQKMSPGIIADPRTDRSIFRINRDTRFAKDKSPYKTHLGIFFWEGNRPKMECPGFYFHLEPPTLMLAAGLYCFPKHLLETYRDAVVSPKHGPALAKAIREVTKPKGYEVGEVHYKKTPRGYDANHANAKYLLYSGLYVMVNEPAPQELFSSKLLDHCFERFRLMAPLHRWLHTITQ
ncbi:MAG: DUF2461 domain-containing protein [Deltaproteobacteria bacterium]|nr:DUF2461 domain-containing protein [Deltaproteobacteria bacterium]